MLLTHDAMEAAMRGSFEKSGEAIKRAYRNWGSGIFALPLLATIGLVGLALNHPSASNWMSEAVKAEFAGAHVSPPEVASTPGAQPAMAIRTVRAD